MATILTSNARFCNDGKAKAGPFQVRSALVLTPQPGPAAIALVVLAGESIRLTPCNSTRLPKWPASNEYRARACPNRLRGETLIFGQ